MTCQLGKLCSLLLREYFGEVVQKIGTELYKFGPLTLPKLLNNTKLPLEHAKYGLCILIQYGFVTFIKSSLPKRASYKLFPEKVILLLRYPRYLLHIKTKYSNHAEMMIEEILRTGPEICPKILLRVANRIREADPDAKIDVPNLRDTFITLINNKYLKRCPQPENLEEDEKVSSSSAVPSLILSDREMFQPPKIDMHSLSLAIKNKETTLQNTPSVSDVYWTVNFDRFHQDFRDELMINAITRRIDDSAGQLMKYLLELMYLRTEPWVETSNPIPFTELKETIRVNNASGFIELFQFYEQYLSLIVEDSSNFLQKSGEGSGGQYIVNIKQAIIQLTWATIERIVLERFGDKSARIFRLIRHKKYIEQEQIQQLAMIPSKEAKELTYRLMEEDFIQIQELSKSGPAGGPMGQLNKCFFLFYVDLTRVTRMLLDYYYKAIYNIISSAVNGRQDNKHILEKHQRIETIVLSLKEQGASQEQITEIEEMMTPPETLLLEKVRCMLKKLSIAEKHLDESIFILQLYIRIHDNCA